MKISRHKKVQRFLGFYSNFFKFHQPYQLLVDGTFCFAARQEQINIKEQLSKYLASEVKFLTTRCIIIETETIAKKALKASTIIKQFGIHKCYHTTPLSGSECILSMIGKKNKNHYVVATQDRSLQDSLRIIPGVPLIYLHKKAPTLEAPSEASNRLAKASENNCTVTESQIDTIKTLKKNCGLPVFEKIKVEKEKKKRKKGPNPLSCLKKKKKSQNNQNKTNQIKEGKVKKRVRVKLPTHVKKSLLENK